MASIEKTTVMRDSEQQGTRPQERSVSQFVVRGTIFRTMTFALTALVGLLLMPFIVHSLGNRSYGMWALVGSILNYFSLFDLGISSAVERFVSRALGQEDIPAANTIISSATFLFTGLGLALITLVILTSVSIPFLIHDTHDGILLGQIILIVGLGLGFTFPGRVFEGLFSAQLRQDVLSTVWIIVLICRTLIIIMVLRLGWGLKGLALATSISIVVRYVILIALGRKSHPWLSISLHLCRRHRIQELLGYGLVGFLNRIGDFLRFHLDNIVIGSFLGLTPITLYTIPVKLLEYFTNFMLSAVGFVAPVFSRYEGLGESKALKNRFLDITRVSTIAATFVGSSLLFYGKPFITRWMGEAYTSSYDVLLMLGVPAIFSLMSNPSISLLYGISKHHYYTIANILEGFTNLSLSLLLVRQYGIYGVALGTAIPMIIFKLGIQPIYTCRSIKLDLRRYYRILFFTTLKSFLPIMVYYMAIQRLLGPTFISMFPIWIGQTILFLPIAWRYILRPRDRRTIKSALSPDRTVRCS